MQKEEAGGRVRGRVKETEGKGKVKGVRVEE